MKKCFIAIALFGFARMSGFIPGLERWASVLQGVLDQLPVDRRIVHHEHLKFGYCIRHALLSSRSNQSGTIPAIRWKENVAPF